MKSTDPSGKPPNRLARLAKSIKEIGDIEVTDWDFMEILHTNVEDLEVARSLRRLGRIRVTDWEFRDVLPAVNKIAHKEVHLVDAFKRAAAYRVMEWDFRDLLDDDEDDGENQAGGMHRSAPSGEELQRIIRSFTSFLGFVCRGLIEHPDHACIKVVEIEPGVLRFKLVLVKRDAAALIGHGGHTAAAIRRLLQAAGRRQGVHVLLAVLSHEEDAGTNAPM